MPFGISIAAESCNRAISNARYSDKSDSRTLRDVRMPGLSIRRNARFRFLNVAPPVITHECALARNIDSVMQKHCEKEGKRRPTAIVLIKKINARYQSKPPLGRVITANFDAPVDTRAPHTSARSAIYNVLETAKRNLLPDVARLRYVLLSAT